MNDRSEIPLSFLDVLSCSLGAMIVLFFIFSALTHEGTRELSVPDDLGQAERIEGSTLASGGELTQIRPKLFRVDYEKCQFGAVGSHSETFVLSDNGRGTALILATTHRTPEDVVSVEISNCAPNSVLTIKSLRDQLEQSFTFRADEISAIQFLDPIWEGRP